MVIPLDSYFSNAFCAAVSSLPANVHGIPLFRWHLKIVNDGNYVFAVQVTTRQASQWCSVKGGVPSFEASARDAVNVEHAFYEVARRALALEQQSEQYSDFPDQIRLGAAHQSHRDREQCSC